MRQIEFRSDHAAGVAPEIMTAVADANTGSTISYGADDVTSRLETVVREVFEHPSARGFPSPAARPPKLCRWGRIDMTG